MSNGSAIAWPLLKQPQASHQARSPLALAEPGQGDPQPPSSLPSTHPVGPWFLSELLALGLWILLASSGAASLSEGLGWMVGLSLMLRCSWQGAMLLHGLGHSLGRALVDRQASALNLTNILEQRSPGQVLASLWPLSPLLWQVAVCPG
ncbi:MAG: hypothetical protein LVS60_09465 [Nodosilinea sp. LVE1205-7]